MTSLTVETDARGCRTLWLDRPAKRNALDEALLQSILDEAQAAERDEMVRVIVLRSTSQTFCAGADLNEWAHISPREARRLSALGSRAFQALADVSVPVVAVMEGPVLGGGLELALACDIRIGTGACKLGFPEPRLGNSPAWGGMARLVNVAGIAAARDLLLTGNVIPAEEAHRLGVLQRYCPAVDLPTELAALVESILACETGTLGFIKAILGTPAQAIAAQEAAMAGYTAISAGSRERKEQFLASRRSEAVSG